MTELFAFAGLEKTTPEFAGAFVRMCASLGIDPNHLAAVIRIESGFNPKARNKDTDASGLIQFMPATARALGTTTAAIRELSDVEQLPLVAKFLAKSARSMTSAGQAYVAVFMPGHLGKPDDFVLFRDEPKFNAAGKRIDGYFVNRGLDIDKSGAITVGDVRGIGEASYLAGKARGVFRGSTVVGGVVDPSAVDAYATNVPQSKCDPTEKPGAQAFRELVLSKFGGRDGGISRSCSAPGTSEHKEGRAWDWMIPTPAAADACLAWLLEAEGDAEHARARRYGVQYLIYNRQLWAAYPPRGWRPYTKPGGDPHTDHVHFTFSWDGARKLTTGYHGNDDNFGRGGGAFTWWRSALAARPSVVIVGALLAPLAGLVAWHERKRLRFT